MNIIQAHGRFEGRRAYSWIALLVERGRQLSMTLLILRNYIVQHLGFDLTGVLF